MNPRRTLLSTITIFASALFTACSGGGGGGPRACAGSERCAALEHCVSGTCVADSAPIAAFESPASIEAFALVELDGAASRDPDAEDVIVAHAWSFTALDAPCAPPQVAGTEARAKVRFGCPGRFGVQLIVHDGRGVPSAAVEHEIQVTQPGMSHLTTAADINVSHACTGQPLVCALSQPVTLEAQAVEPVGIAVYHWSVEPPEGRALDETRRVTFAAEDEARGEVAITTDGTALSGDWIFRVEARDDAGPLGSAVQRVSVTNLPPEVRWSAATSYAHRFADGIFSSFGEVGFTLTDPEGDPLGEPSFVYRHTGDGEGTFDGKQTNPTTVLFHVTVPYNGDPAAFGQLIGGSGLSRAVELTVADVNGATTTAAQPVVIGNQPPFPLSTKLSLQSVDHWFDGTAYVARADFASAWRDPENDPIFQTTEGTGDATCSSFTVNANGGITVNCRKLYEGAPGLVSILGAHDLTFKVGDPWAKAADTTQTGTVYVNNRAPTASNSSSSRSLTCSAADPTDDNCCRYVGDRCVSFGRILPGGNFSFVPQATDPDGDPLTLYVASGSNHVTATCNGPCPAVTVNAFPIGACNVSSATDTWSISATDGGSSTSATFTLSRSCQ